MEVQGIKVCVILMSDQSHEVAWRGISNGVVELVTELHIDGTRAPWSGQKQ